MIVPTKLRNEKRSQTIPRKKTPPKLFENSSPVKALDTSAREISLIRELPSGEVSPTRELEQKISDTASDRQANVVKIETIQSKLAAALHAKFVEATKKASVKPKKKTKDVSMFMAKPQLSMYSIEQQTGVTINLSPSPKATEKNNLKR